jgi:hypothetical protein
LADSNEDARVKVSSFANSNAFKFFSAHTGKIEVVIGEDLQRVYFPI